MGVERLAKEETEEGEGGGDEGGKSFEEYKSKLDDEG